MRRCLFLVALIVSTALGCASHDSGIPTPPERPAGAKSCGEISGDQCGGGEICVRQPGDLCGAADAAGFCIKQPDVCPAATGAPVCGCDGKAYASQCVAFASGVDVSYDRNCF